MLVLEMVGYEGVIVGLYGEPKRWATQELLSEKVGYKDVIVEQKGWTERWATRVLYLTSWPSNTSTQVRPQFLDLLNCMGLGTCSSA